MSVNENVMQLIFIRAKNGTEWRFLQFLFKNVVVKASKLAIFKIQDARFGK